MDVVARPSVKLSGAGSSPAVTQLSLGALLHRPLEIRFAGGFGRAQISTQRAGDGLKLIVDHSYHEGETSPELPRLQVLLDGLRLPRAEISAVSVGKGADGNEVFETRSRFEQVVRPGANVRVTFDGLDVAST